MKKQYFYEEAYSGNYEVTLYEDGIIADSDIIAVYNLSGYIERIKDEGYSFGYPKEVIEDLEKERRQIQERLEEINEILANKDNRI